jgi:hypothetical protein
MSPLPSSKDKLESVVLEAQGNKKPRVREELYNRFWAQLVDTSKLTTSLLSHVGLKGNYCISTKKMKGGIKFTLSLQKDLARIECNVNFGKKERMRSEQVYWDLKKKRAGIERDFGSELDWKDIPKKSDFIVCKDLVGGWSVEEETWPTLQRAMIENLILLERSFNEPIHRLKSDRSNNDHAPQ